MTDSPRLIEFAFPLKQTLLDSVHEKEEYHDENGTSGINQKWRKFRRRV
jgi:hypothetical protein